MTQAGTVLAGALLVLVVGCVRDDPSTADNPAAVTYEHIRQRLGTTEQFVATIVIAQRPAEGRSFDFRMTLWRTESGHLRARMLKIGTDFLDAQVEPTDGQFAAFLPQDDALVEGWVMELASIAEQEQRATGTTFYGEFDRFVDLLRIGPLPDVDPASCTIVDTGSNTRQLVIPDRNLTIVLHLEPPRDTIAMVRWLDGDREILRIHFDRWETMEGVERPVIWRPEFPGDDTVYIARLAELDSVPSIAADRMVIDPSDSAQPMTVHGFLNYLRGDPVDTP